MSDDRDRAQTAVQCGLRDASLEICGGSVRAVALRKRTWTMLLSANSVRACEPLIADIAINRDRVGDQRVLVAGDRVFVRREASGMPVTQFMGVAPSGGSFKTMSIDIHTLAAGRLVRSYHVEDWMSATRQLAK